MDLDLTVNTVNVVAPKFSQHEILKGTAMYILSILSILRKNPCYYIYPFCHSLEGQGPKHNGLIYSIEPSPCCKFCHEQIVIQGWIESSLVK